jgi:hypothetical protein
MCSKLKNFFSCITSESRKKADYEEEFPDVNAKYLIFYSHGKFIVAIDDQNDLDWETKPEFDSFILSEGKKTEISHILNQAALLEIRPIQKWPHDTLMAAKRIIGEAIARAYQFEFENANKILLEAESFINRKSPEVSRFWAMQSSSVSVLILMALCFVSILFKDLIIPYIGSTIFYSFINACCGGLGAYLFVLMRLGKFNLDSETGRGLHYANGCSRIIIGCISGFLVGLLIKSGVVFSIFANNQHAIYAICLIAGASETMVPGIISKLEVKEISTNSGEYNANS